MKSSIWSKTAPMGLGLPGEGEHVVGALLVTVFVLRDVRIGHPHGDRDEFLGHSSPSCGAEQRNHLQLPWQVPEPASHCAKNGEDLLAVLIWQHLDVPQGVGLCSGWEAPLRWVELVLLGHDNNEQSITKPSLVRSSANHAYKHCPYNGEKV